MSFQDTISALDQMVTDFDGDPHPAAQILVQAAIIYRNSLMTAGDPVHTEDETCWRPVKDLGEDPCPACDYAEVHSDLGPLLDAWAIVSDSTNEVTSD